MRIRLRAKLILVTVSTIVLTIGLSTYLNVWDFLRAYREVVIEKVFFQLKPLQLTIQEIIELNVDFDALDGIDTECRNMVATTKYAQYCCVTDNANHVLYHSDPEKLGSIYACPDAQTVAQSEQRTVRTFAVEPGSKLYDFSLPVNKPTGERIGWIHLGMQPNIIDARARALMLKAVTLGVLFTFAAALVVILLSNYTILKPIKQLMWGIARFGSGKLDTRVTLKTNDEIAELAASYNHMAESILQHIEDIKQAKQELAQLLSLHTAILEATADGILVVDTKGKVVSFNQKFQQLWRIPDELIQRQDDNKLLTFVLDQLVDAEAFIAEVQRLYTHPDESSFDRLWFKDGRVFERYSQPHCVNGAIVGRVWSFRDMTERVKAEERQTHLLGQLEEKNQELKDFAHIVSHDLKAPLRGVKVISDWIAQDYGDKLDDEGKEQINLLISRVDRMHDLIDGILQYSRVGRIEEKKIAVDLNDLIAEIIDGIAPPETITIAVEQSLPVVNCEPTRLMQVLQNLISNAVKYMDKPEGHIMVSCVQKATCWQFSVNDNGPGIEERYYESIFRMFQTLSSRDQFESTGVGLAVVKRIVEMYGGEIWVESVVGQGSTFFFTLPKDTMEPECLETISSDAAL